MNEQTGRIVKPWERVQAPAQNWPQPPAPPVPIAPAQVIPPVTPATPPAANLPPGATSEPAVPIAEKIIGAGIIAAPNAVSLATVDVWLTPMSGALNVGIEWLKNRRWFPESVLTVPVLILGAIVLGVGLWFGIPYLMHQQPKAPDEIAGRIGWLITNCHAQWTGGKRLGIFAPTALENKFGG